MYKYNNSCIQLFVREPVRGAVKSRLQKVLGEDRTLALYLALLRYQVSRVRQAALAPLELWVAGNPDHNLLQGLGDPAALFAQIGNDLGQRMLMAARTGLRHHDAVIIIGSDCPSVDAGYLDQAFQLLHKGTPVVLGPADDGGYVLLGVRQVSEVLFEGVEWGSMNVLQQTTSNLDAAGIEYHLLESLWDVDRPEDLVRLSELKPPLDY